MDQALAVLTQQALRNVDSAHATRLGADNKDAQAFLNTLGQGKTLIDKETGQAYQLFTADEATRNNHAMFGQHTKTPAVENLLDRAYAAVTLPKDAQTIQGLNGSFKGSLTGSDLALNDAARDTSNMWKQPPVVQWAVLGHLRQERVENMQGQIDLMDELRKLNTSGVSSPADVERKSQIINDLTNLENENQVLLGAARVHILGMGQNGLLSPIDQRETFKGFGSARASGGVNFRGMSSASINVRIGELKFAKATAAAEAKALEQARINNNFLRDGNQTESWSAGKPDDINLNAYGHWTKHGKEFPDIKSPRDYIDTANKFVNSPPPGTLIKQSGQDTLYYHPATNTFVVKAPNGSPRTMFKPDPSAHGFPTNLDFWNAKK